MIWQVRLRIQIGPERWRATALYGQGLPCPGRIFRGIPCEHSVDLIHDRCGSHAAGVLTSTLRMLKAFTDSTGLPAGRGVIDPRPPGKGYGGQQNFSERRQKDR
jgi:hypothetical protein